VHPRALVAAVAALAAGCGSSALGDPPIKTVMIGQEGGQAASVDGSLKLQVPPGALESSVPITIQQIDAPAAGAVGATFEIGPSATKLTAPVTILVSYRPSDIAAANPSDLRVATFWQGAWAPVTSAINAGAYVVSAQITHFSPWGLVLMTALAAPPDDAGTAPGSP